MYPNRARVWLCVRVRVRVREKEREEESDTVSCRARACVRLRVFLKLYVLLPEGYEDTSYMFRSTPRLQLVENGQVTLSYCPSLSQP